jgi:hypothetical protein
MTASQRDPDRFVCLVCEDVRAEVGGKLTVLGFMPGDTINVPPGILNPQLNLTFVFVFNKAEGEFTGSFSLTGPIGIVGAEIPIPTAHVEPDTGMVSVFQFKPTPQIPLGRYVAKVTLNGRSYEQKILLRAAPVPLTATASATTTGSFKH